MSFVSNSGLQYYHNKMKTLLAGKSDTNHTHNYAGSSSAGGAADSAKALATTITVRPDSGNDLYHQGYRLIAGIQLGAWANHRAVLAIRSRHSGNGILTISIRLDSETVSISNTVSVIDYFGSTEGSTVSDDSFLITQTSDGTKAYIFCKYYDYGDVSIKVLDSSINFGIYDYFTSIPTDTHGTIVARTNIIGNLTNSEIDAMF